MKTTLFKHRLLSQKRFKKVLISLVAVSVILGMMVTLVEMRSPDAKITNLFDGMWWAVTTTTTVGYGDIVPVTVGGKFLGMILQVIGVILFGSLIGIISVYITRVEKEYRWKKLFERLNELEGKIDSLKKQGEFIMRKDDDKK